MNRITDFVVLEHFTSNILGTPNTFGKYWFKVNGRNVLVVRRDNEWFSVQNIISQSYRDCLAKIRDDLIEEIDEFLRYMKLK